jgi:prepilin peptidase CpaA
MTAPRRDGAAGAWATGGPIKATAELTRLSGFAVTLAPVDRSPTLKPWPMLKDILLITIFPAAMALSAATDLFTMTVPNRIAIALVAGFVVLAPLVGLGWTELGIHAALAAVALVLGFVMFSFGWIGGGDAKLFAATCLWLGPETMFSYGMLTALFGGALTLGLLVWRQFPLPVMLNSQGWLVRLHSPREGVPYGIALAAAGLMVYPQTPFMAALGA